MVKKDSRMVLSLFVIILGLTACQTTGGARQNAPVTSTIPTTPQAPEWITKGCKEQMALCGVGSASTLGDYSLGRREAENFARVELRSQIETYVGYLMESYKARITSGDPDAVSLESKTEEAMKNVVGGTISGAKIVDRWEHPTKNLIFALAKLDLASFKSTVDKMNGLSEEFKESVRKNADKMMEKLNAELEKKKNN